MTARGHGIFTFCLAVFAAMVLCPALADAAPSIPKLTMELAAGQAEPSDVSTLLEILFLLTVLSMAPAIMLTMTSFTRIIIVFHFLRQAMGTQQMPPNQILAGLAIFMTLVIMMPAGKTHNEFRCHFATPTEIRAHWSPGKTVCRVTGTY